MMRQNNTKVFLKNTLQVLGETLHICCVDTTQKYFLKTFILQNIAGWGLGKQNILLYQSNTTVLENIIVFIHY